MLHRYLSCIDYRKKKALAPKRLLLGCIAVEFPSRRGDILLASESDAEKRCQYKLSGSYDRSTNLSVEYQFQLSLSESSKGSTFQHFLDLTNDGAETF